MDNVSFYNMMSVVSAICCLLMLVLAILLWKKLDIRHLFAVLTGTGAKKSIERIRKSAAEGGVHADLYGRANKAILSWNTSSSLASKELNATEPLVAGNTPFMSAAANVDNNATTLLAGNNLNGAVPQQDTASDYATTVLSAIKESEFVIEREIVNRGQ